MKKALGFIVSIAMALVTFIAIVFAIPVVVKLFFMWCNFLKIFPLIK